MYIPDYLQMMSYIYCPTCKQICNDNIRLEVSVYLPTLLQILFISREEDREEVFHRSYPILLGMATEIKRTK